MKPNHFTWNNKSSLEFGLRILNREIPRPSPWDAHDRTTIHGRDGDIVTKRDTIPSADLMIRSHVLDVTRVDEINEWLRLQPSGDLRLSWDDGYIYRAHFLDTYDMDTKLIKLGQTDLRFLVYPWKYLVEGQAPRVTNAPENPTPWPAKPIYEITGQGDVEVLINDESLRLKNVSGTVTIDTEREVVQGLAWENVLTYPFPELKPGKNTFSEELRITPNWRRRL